MAPPTAADVANQPDWRAAGLRYYSYNFFLRQKFGQRVQKVSLDAGFTCPNVDGTVAIGGCTFCDNRSFSPSRRVPPAGHSRTRLDDGIRRLKHALRRSISSSPTFSRRRTPTPRSSGCGALYEQALAHPQVVGLAIGTRPDCVPDDVLDLLQEFAGRTYLSVEYGMQTMHDRSLDWMNRGHHHDATVRRHRAQPRPRLRDLRPRDPRPARRIARRHAGHGPRSRPAWASTPSRSTICTPSRTRRWPTRSRAGEVTLMERDDYIRTLVDFLELLPPDDDRRAHQRRCPARLLRRPELVPRQTRYSAGAPARAHSPRYLAG